MIKINKQKEIIEMLERCLSRKDSICYRLFKEEWETKLTIAKTNFNQLVYWNEEIKDSLKLESNIRKLFLIPLSTIVRDGIRAWDDEHFGTKRNWNKK